MRKAAIVATCIALAGCAGGYGGDGGMQLSPAASPRAIEHSVPPLAPNSSMPDATLPRRPDAATADAAPNAPGPSVAAAAPAGEWSFNAERLARDARCADAPVVRMTGKGPAFETYASQCRDGSTLQIRCDYGTCRAL